MEIVKGYSPVKSRYDQDIDDPSACCHAVEVIVGAAGALAGMSIGAYLLNIYDCSYENEECVMRQGMWAIPLVLGVAALLTAEKVRQLCCRTIRV